MIPLPESQKWLFWISHKSANGHLLLDQVSSSAKYLMLLIVIYVSLVNLSSNAKHLIWLIKLFLFLKDFILVLCIFVILFDF